MDGRWSEGAFEGGSTLLNWNEFSEISWTLDEREHLSVYFGIAVRKLFLDTVLKVHRNWLKED